MLPVKFCWFYLGKITAFSSWSAFVCSASATLERGAKRQTENCCTVFLQPFAKCLYFSFILLFISGAYYCVTVPGAHPNVCLHKVGFCKTKTSEVSVLKRWCEWRMCLKYKGIETHLGEGLNLEDVLVIHETLTNQHTEKGQVKNVGFLLRGKKVRQISVPRAQVHGHHYVQ